MRREIYWGKRQIEKDVRKTIFFEELVGLRVGNYINEQEYGYIVKKYNKYYSTLNEVIEKKETEIKSINDNVLTNEEIYKLANVNRGDQYPKTNVEKKIPQKKVVREKKIISSEDIRERNLTILLLLGTVFIFIAGLIFATTTWDVIGDLFKTIILILMGTIFFGISVFCEKILKINKTGFTFWILGTLFLPLSLVSIKFLGLLGEYLSIYGEGTYLFNVISGLICLPIFYYSFKRYKKKFYLYIGIVTIDYLIVNLGLSLFIDTVYTILLISIFNVVLIYLNKVKYEIAEKNRGEIISFNIIISFILLCVNVTNTYVFYLNLLVLAWVFLYLNYINRQVMVQYSIGAAIFIAIGFTGSVAKFIATYLINPYMLMIPLMLFGIYYLIYTQFYKIFNMKDKCIRNVSISTGIISIILISLISPFYLEYRVMALVSLLINGILLLYINKKEGGRVYTYLLQFSLLVVIGSVVNLLDVNISSIDINLRKSIIVVLLFGIWILLRKVKLLEKVYKLMLFGFYGYSILYCLRYIVYIEVSNIFINLIFISLISFYGYKQNIIKKTSIVATIISSYLVLISSYLKVISIYKDYNSILHMIIVSVIIVGIIYIAKYKFNSYSENSKYLIITNNVISLLLIEVVNLFSMKIDLVTNLVFTEILLIINIAYYVYNYIVSKREAYPSIIAINFGISIYYIGHLFDYKYSYYIGILATMLVMFIGYVYFRKDVERKKNITENLYLFFIVTIILGNVNSILLNIITISIIIGVLIIAYREKNIMLNIISILGSIYLTDIILRHLFKEEIIIFITYAIIIIGLRCLGLKIYKSIFEKGKLDVLSILSCTFIFISSKYIYIASHFEIELCVFIILTIISMLLFAEIIRDKKNTGVIVITSQGLLSLGLYNFIVYSHLTLGVTSKLCMVLIIGFYLSYKTFWKTIFTINVDIIISIISIFLLLKDIVLIDSITNNIFMSIIVIVVTIISMRKENKILLNTSVLNLLIIVIFASRVFIFGLIFSIPWWAYLLITGSGFVGGAIYLERKRNKDNS